MQPVIVAFDDHEHASEALRWGASFATLTGAPLSVINIFEPTYSEIDPDWIHELLERRRSHVEKVLDELDAVGTDIIVQVGNDPIAAITSLVVEHDAAIVVIGSRSVGGPGGLGASSPAHHLIQHTHVPVAVVHPAFPPLHAGRFIVGVDGSSANLAAIEFAAHSAQAVGGSLEAVHVLEHMHDHDCAARLQRDIRRDLDNFAADVPVEEAVGHPVDALIDAARRSGAAALVVGTRGHEGFDGLRVGRVPLQLVTHAPCPVIVVPH